VAVEPRSLIDWTLLEKPVVIVAIADQRLVSRSGVGDGRPE
jgi:hypothetical protein